MTKFIARTAIIASLYFAVTVALSPISYGPIQFRLSECFAMLAIFYPEAVIGLTIGCFFSNLFGNGLLDIVFGTLATLLATYTTYKACKKVHKLSKRIALAITFNVLFNALLVPISFAAYSSAIRFYFSGILTVGAGQLVVLSTLGIIVAYGIDRTKNNHLLK